MEKSIAFLVIFIVACFSCGSGGGGGGSQPIIVDNNQTLNWVPPTKFIDNTDCDPKRDIDLYEIHVSDNCDWSVETLKAVVTSVDNEGTVVNKFTLSNFVILGITPSDNGTSLTVRSVTNQGLPSEYGKPVLWEVK